MSDDLRKEIWSYFKDMQVVFLTTMDNEQPRVRPVSMLHFNKKLWVGTGTSSAKVRQLKNNNKAEFCLYIVQDEHNAGYIRGQCVVNIIEDKDTKQQLADQMPFFRQFWKGHDDPRYTLLQFDMKEIEFLKPGSFNTKKISF